MVCARPARHPSLAATPSSCPRARRAQTAWPCWYLNGIGVDPSAQRTGLGSALINQMLPRIDEDALPAFLDTSEPDNLGYYERFRLSGDGGVDITERYPPLGHDAAGVSGSGGMRPRARRSVSGTQEGEAR